MSSSSSSHEDERRAQEFSNLVQEFNQIVQAIGDSDAQPRRWRRRVAKKAYIYRDREADALHLHADYFDENSVYPDNVFRRRFCTRRALFLRIVNVVQSDSYFQQRTDALGRPGFTLLQKCTVAVRMLANCGAADQYVGVLVQILSSHYSTLRRRILEEAGFRRVPTASSNARSEARLPGNAREPRLHALAVEELGNRPSSSKSSHRKIYGSGMLFFGTPGSNNDINVFNNSTLFNDRLQGMGVPVTYQVNNAYYTSVYYLTDGIYPNWPVFVKSPTHPTDPKGKRFKVMQEAARKDIERAFGVLQARWTIVKGPSRLWSKEEMNDIMFTCIILHNMIIEDEGEHATQWEEDADEASSSAASQPHASTPPDFRVFVARQASMRDTEMHACLTLDLKEHIWCL
ncbi:uncharacterized protein LOC130994371 [Salvia miltiorrhiza]|uniref:uncharacterized protein LOC130994371 n=1 Tax=Salvia miltiorrhiza TaxID=226208 RepID=UPI0025AC96F1|nr:uncharacterized protein LOC130994371 [Salvia miltiorrhiza]